MVDNITHQRITVDGVPIDGAHIIVPADQWPAAREALGQGGVKFWLAGEPIVVGDDPPVLWVVLSRSSDASHVQQILDGI